jgi:predicted metalloprotease with PDZ domain
VNEALALYQSHHYREYHFLLTLSDNVMGLGQSTTKAATTAFRPNPP